MAKMARMQWSGNLEFMFAGIGYAVGLGNIWRFPYRCYVNGGGAFLFPYFLTLIFCVIPLLLLEILLGQFASTGPITVWKFCPIFQGVGWAIIFNVFITSISYIVLVMYAMYYLLVSFVNIGRDLPWQHCDHKREGAWNTDLCRDVPLPDFSSYADNNSKINALNEMMDATCKAKIEQTIKNSTIMTFEQYRNFFKSCETRFASPEEEYWNRFVLGAHESEGVNDLGTVIGRNLVTLLIVWMVVYYCCLKGIREITKVIYVTASFPTLTLLILLVRGVTLDGHGVGISFYITPDWSQLSDMGIWASAGTQAMYSVGIAFGSYIALASHNRFSNNSIRDALALVLCNTFTSILAGFVVFAFLGHASLKLNRPLKEIFDHGPGIIFISYLQGISQLRGAAVWACLFFGVVFTLGVDSVFVMVWTVYEAIHDVFPDRFKQRGKYILVGMCLLMFILGIPLVTEGGIHMLVLMDRYTSDFTLTLFLIFECIAVCWVYGLQRFLEDVEMMLGTLPVLLRWYLQFTLAVSAPAFCLFIFVASGVGYTTVSYNGIETTAGGETIGILLIVTPALISVGVAAVTIKKQGLRNAYKPTADWGPDDPENRKGRYSPEDYITPVS